MQNLTFLAQAKRGNNGFVAYFITFLLLIIGNTIGSLPLIAVMIGNALRSGSDMQAALAKMGNMADSGVDTNLMFALMLFTFVTTLGGLWLGVRTMHKRPFLSLVNQFDTIRWERFFFAFGVWFALTTVMELVNYVTHPSDYHFSLQFAPFLVTLLIAVTLIPLQTAFEELLFRGWLMQAIGSFNIPRYVPLIITSVLFGSLHFANPEVAKYGIAPMMVYYIGFGLLMGMLTLLDDGLDLALGLHCANNLYGSTVVSFTSSALQTYTIFQSKDPDMTLMLPVSIAAGIAAFLIFRWRFGFAPMSALLEKA